MRRWLVNLIAMLSLLLCVGTVGLWSPSNFWIRGWRGTFILSGSPIAEDFTITRWAFFYGGFSVSRADWLRYTPGHVPSVTAEQLGLSVPFSAVGGVAAYGLCIFTVTQVQKYRRERRVALGLCPACGYDLRASPEHCPECGTTRSSA